MGRNQWLPPCRHLEHVPGWHFQKGPARELVEHHGMARYWVPTWATNQYRRHNVDGTWTYYAEPIRDFDTEALKDLQHLRHNGYTVRLISTRAHRTQGPTICITKVNT